jgi:hypothetical protein
VSREAKVILRKIDVDDAIANLRSVFEPIVGMARCAKPAFPADASLDVLARISDALAVLDAAEPSGGAS